MPTDRRCCCCWHYAARSLSFIDSRAVRPLVCRQSAAVSPTAGRCSSVRDVYENKPNPDGQGAPNVVGRRSARRVSGSESRYRRTSLRRRQLCRRLGALRFELYSFNDVGLLLGWVCVYRTLHCGVWPALEQFDRGDIRPDRLTDVFAAAEVARVFDDTARDDAQCAVAVYS